MAGVARGASSAIRTEGALVVAAAKGGFSRSGQPGAAARVGEIPFDSERKRMSTLHRVDDAAQRAAWSGLGEPALVAFVKGAPDVILELCTQQLEGGRAISLSTVQREAILEQNHAMASGALRVLAIAHRPFAELPPTIGPETVENDLIFVGLLGMIDPPRPEVMAAPQRARRRAQEHHGDRRLPGHGAGDRSRNRPAEPGVGWCSAARRSSNSPIASSPSRSIDSTSAAFRRCTRRASSTRSNRAATSSR